MKEYNHNELKKENIVAYLKDSIRLSFSAAEFDWEFNTPKDSVIFKLYKDEERLIASQAMLPIKLVVNDKTIRTVKSESSYLNKDYRGKNYFEDLYFSAIKASQENGFQIIWGFTPAVKVWKTKLNFDVVLPNISEATITISKYPSNSFLKKYTKNKITLLRKIAMYSLIRIFEERPNYPLIHTSLEVNSAFPDASVIQTFQKKNSEKNKLDVYLDFNEEYINWRIKTNPLLKYQSYFFYNHSDLVGYILFSITEDRLSVADISYLDAETGKYILTYTLNHHSRAVNSVFYFGNDDSEYGKNTFDLFKTYNAQVKKSDWANTVIKDVSDDGRYKSALDTSRWFINGLWTEGYSI